MNGSPIPIVIGRRLGFDCGSAFDQGASAKLKTGLGGELWMDFALGYIVGFEFRAGFARGVSSGGIDKLYFVAVAAF